MFKLELEEVKEWLKLDDNDSDMLVESLILSAESYLYTATGRRKYGEQTELAKLICMYIITHWFEDRDYYNPSPQSVRKPMLTMMMTQLQFGLSGAGEE